MNKQKTIFKAGFLSLFFLLVITQPQAAAQTVSITDKVKEITLPSGSDLHHLYLEAKGGDGGNGHAATCRGYGGSGAVVKALFEVGSGSGQIPHGATLRFVRGYAGASQTTKVNAGGAIANGGGGFRSSVLYRRPGSTSENDWKDLVVAGGGGGGHSVMAFWVCIEEDNGQGGRDVESGGTSGGSAGGGGGGSYVRSGSLAHLLSAGKSGGGKTEDGYLKYEFNPDLENLSYLFKKWIHLKQDNFKCLAVAEQGVHNGANIQLSNCKTGDFKQLWIMDGQMIKLGNGSNLCLEVSGSNAHNGANIDIWTCNNNTNAQKWVYDGVKRLIRSALDLNKCLDLAGGKPESGTNIQLYNCSTSDRQQWIIDGATLSSTDESLQIIRSGSNVNKCIHIKDGEPVNVANIEMWDCLGTMAQKWYFNGSSIKASENKNKCIGASAFGSSNGTNLILYECDEKADQQWIYDGLTQTIRSGMNVNKCMQIKDGSSANGANIELWDCLGTAAQQFVIQSAECSAGNDTTPPVAKCRDVTFSGGLAVPTAADIDNGSTDNCSISELKLDQVAGNQYKLTVTDPSGNSSSCTATVSYN